MDTPYLSDIEQQKVTSFLNDAILVEAVKKVLFRPIYSEGVLAADKSPNALMNFALNVYKTSHDGSNEMYSDEELGRLTKVRRLAIELVITAFRELEQLRKVEGAVLESKNKAR
jgi:hypothetical protein